MWANVLGMQASFVIMVGGFLNQSSVFARGTSFGVYGIIAGFVIGVFEYPRGKRMGGHSTIPRSYQDVLTPFVAYFGVLTRNYFARSIIYLLACVPMYFSFPLVIGATILALSGLVYFWAALLGEEWQPLPPQKSEDGPRKPYVHQAPTKPPPRLPPRLREGGGGQASSRGAGGGGGKDAAAAQKARPAPPSAPIPPPPSSALDASAGKWVSAKDPVSGAVYYINTATGDTTWERPANVFDVSNELHASSES